MRTFFICLMAATTIFFAFRPANPKGPQVRFLGDDELTEMPEDFFKHADWHPCWLGDTIDIWDNPYIYINEGLPKYMYFGKTKPPVFVEINGAPIMLRAPFDPYAPIYQAIVVSIK